MRLQVAHKQDAGASPGKATCRRDPRVKPLDPFISFSSVWLSLSSPSLLRLWFPLSSCHRVPSNSLRELFVYLKDSPPMARPEEGEAADPTHPVRPIGAALWRRHGPPRYPALLGQCVSDQLGRVTSAACSTLASH